MTPVVAVRTVPCGETSREHGSVVSGCKLLKKSEACFAANETGHRLDQPRFWVGLHCCCKLLESSRGHDTVGIKDDEVQIGGTEVFDPILDVAGFPVDIRRSPRK